MNFNNSTSIRLQIANNLFIFKFFPILTQLILNSNKDSYLTRKITLSIVAAALLPVYRQLTSPLHHIAVASFKTI